MLSIEAAKKHDNASGNCLVQDDYGVRRGNFKSRAEVIEVHSRSRTRTCTRSHNHRDSHEEAIARRPSRGRHHEDSLIAIGTSQLGDAEVAVARN